MKFEISLILFLAINLFQCDKGNKTATFKSKNLLSNDFAVACNATGIKQATKYNKTKGVISHTLYFHRKFIADDYSEQLFTLPKIWKGDWKKSQQTQLVVCSTIMKTKKAITCPFKKKKQSVKLIGFDATYEVKVFEAKTGVQIAKKNFDLKYEKCPMLYFFRKNQPKEEDDYPRFKQPLIDYLQQFIVKR